MLVIIGLVSETVPGGYEVRFLSESDSAHFSADNLDVELVSLVVDSYPDGRLRRATCRLRFLRGGTTLGYSDASANTPMEFEGSRFVVRGIGWSGLLKVTDLSGAMLRAEVLKAGDCLYYEPAQLFIALYDFFPELSLDSDGKISNESLAPRNPYFAIALKEKNAAGRIELTEPGVQIFCGEVNVSFSSYALVAEIAYGRKPVSALLPIGFAAVLAGLPLYLRRQAKIS